MTNYFDFETIKSVIKVKASLINEAPLRVGRGGEVRPGALDLAVERDHEDRIYIPGSSLKGVMRNFVERIARAEGLNVCDPLNKASKEKEDKEGPCIVCGIFGGGGVRRNTIASHVYILDSYPKENIRTATRTRTAIDRFRQAARTKALFTYEYVPPKIEWNFEMHIYNIDIIDGDENKDLRIKLLRSLLKHMSNFGLQVGGMRSVGLGIIKLSKGVLEKYVIENLEFRFEKSKDINEVIKEW